MIVVSLICIYKFSGGDAAAKVAHVKAKAVAVEPDSRFAEFPRLDGAL
jgi:hypothetical protein